MVNATTIIAHFEILGPSRTLSDPPVRLPYGGMQPADTAWGDVRQGGTGVAIPDPVRRSGRSTRANGGHERVRHLPGSSDDCARVDASRFALPGRLPKYNPERENTFSVSDWQHFCEKDVSIVRRPRPLGLVQWIGASARHTLRPRLIKTGWMPACACWWRFALAEKERLPLAILICSTLRRFHG